jgi:hypothetical protein
MTTFTRTSLGRYSSHFAGNKGYLSPCQCSCISWRSMLRRNHLSSNSYSKRYRNSRAALAMVIGLDVRLHAVTGLRQDRPTRVLKSVSFREALKNTRGFLKNRGAG